MSPILSKSQTPGHGFWCADSCGHPLTRRREVSQAAYSWPSSHTWILSVWYKIGNWIFFFSFMSTTPYGYFYHHSYGLEDSVITQTAKNLPTMREMWVQSLGLEDHLQKGMVTHSSVLPWKSHGQKSQAGYSPMGRKELDMTEWLTLSLSYTLKSWKYPWFAILLLSLTHLNKNITL